MPVKCTECDHEDDEVWDDLGDYFECPECGGELVEK